MDTKIYFATSVQAALEVAREELGENALLVSSKPAPPHARQFGPLEVIFAWDPHDAPSNKDASSSKEVPSTQVANSRMEPVPPKQSEAATLPGTGSVETGMRSAGSWPPCGAP